MKDSVRTNHRNDLSPTELSEAVEALKKLPRGFLPKEAFDVLVQKVVTPAVDLLPLRLNEQGQVEVLLTKREADDPIWPDQWHIPGTVLRATDTEQTYQSAFERVLEGELKGGLQVSGSPVYVMTSFVEVERGRELVLSHYIEVESGSEAPVGRFFPADKIPKEMLEHQIGMVAAIATAYRTFLQGEGEDAYS